MLAYIKYVVALLASCVAATGLAGEKPDGRSVREHVASGPTLYYLALRSGVMRAGPRGESPTNIVASAAAGVGPDGIAIDAEAGHIYWTTMGKVSADDGAVMRANLDGSNVKTIIPPGGTFTPKQLKLDTVNRKLYWSDREGMRVMRANFDGSNIETLVITGTGDEDRKDASRWCVGIAIDVRGGKLYWTQKGGDNAGKGTIKRANLEMPPGATAATRKDIEVLFASLPEPIDLEIDHETRLLYWTDRGDNTISRAPLDPPANYDPAKRKDREIILRNVGEAIGIALDTRRDLLYYTSLDGKLGIATLNGRHVKVLLEKQGALTGIAILE